MASPLEEVITASRARLEVVLQSISGEKDLVLDPTLFTSLNIIAGFSFLKAHEVNNVFKLESAVPTLAPTALYITRSIPSHMKTIADHINKIKAKGGPIPRFILALVPDHDVLCDMILEEEGVFGLIEIRTLGLSLVPMDNDVLTLHMPGFLREVALHGDCTPLPWVARSVLDLEQVYGPFPRAHGIGETARMLVESIQSLRVGREAPHRPSTFSDIIFFDRTVDKVSPLCSQLVYSGLIDEIFGLSGGLCTVGVDITGSDNPTVRLSADTDAVYMQLRDMNFSALPAALRQITRELGSQYEERHSATRIDQLKDFVKKLGGLQSKHKSLSMHVNMCERITRLKNNDDLTRQLDVEHTILSGAERQGEATDWLEEVMCRQMPHMEVLRTLCLLSTAQGGVRQDTYESLRRTYLHAYGYEHLCTFDNLDKMGLFRVREDKATCAFAKLRQALNLMPTGGDTPPTAQVHFGYSPLSANIIWRLLASPNGWDGCDDLRKLLRPLGEVFTEQWRPQPKPQDKGEKPPILIYYLGGVTCSELAALRLIGKELNQRFVIAATSVTNGMAVVQCAVESF